MQQRILSHQTEFTASYNVQNIWRVDARAHTPQVDCLKAAWENVVNRHPILRTVFARSGSAKNKFIQIALRRPNALVKIISTESGDNGTFEFATQQSPLSFGTIHPTHQLSLYISTSDTIFVKLEISHAIIDGFSHQVLLRDPQLAYDEQLESGPGPLYSRFIDYAVRGNHADSLAYWTKYLDRLAPCSMPIVTGEHHQRGDLSSVDISVEHLNSKLYAASRLHGVTVANIFMTAWAIVLHSFVKSPEICFGYLVSGRDVPMERIEDAVGLHINLVPYKCIIPQGSSLQQLLTYVHEDFVRSSPNQSFTLTNAPGEESQGRSLFNTAISFQKDNSSDGEIAPDKTISLERLWSKDPTEVSLTEVTHYWYLYISIMVGF
ncbi:condensation domain-containing protein [Trichoderma velutinum]